MSDLVRLVSLVALVVLWVVAAWLRADPLVLPQPWQLIPGFASAWNSGELLFHLSQTLLRVLWVFVLAITLGTVLGMAMGRYAALDRWLDPWLVVFLNLPALVLIVLCYLWIGLNEIAAIAAVTLNKIPNVATVMREGARTLDPNLAALAKLYDLGRWRRLRLIVLPQLMPFLAAAARSGIAIIWKIVLVVEFLGRSDGVGFQIHLYFQLFDVAMVLVYSLSFVAVMLVIETLLLRPAERYFSRWRR